MLMASLALALLQPWYAATRSIPEALSSFNTLSSPTKSITRHHLPVLDVDAPDLVSHVSLGAAIYSARIERTRRHAQLRSKRQSCAFQMPPNLNGLPSPYCAGLLVGADAWIGWLDLLITNNISSFVEPPPD